MPNSTCRIRKMRSEEYPMLEDFLYEAIFQRDPANRLPRSVVHEPALWIYVDGFGQCPDDHCLCAQVGQVVAGAVWVRNIAGYGSVDDETPEFAISVLPAYRGQRIGADARHARPLEDGGLSEGVARSAKGQLCACDVSRRRLSHGRRKRRGIHHGARPEIDRSVKRARQASGELRCRAICL